MSVQVSSKKKLKQLHASLGGAKKGYYLTQYGQDINSGKEISIDERVAFHTTPSQSYVTALVRGTVRKRRNR